MKLNPSFVFILLVFISHVLLPLMNKVDFFLFSAWRLYGSVEIKETYDISWDNGTTFLFRDHRDLANNKINLQGLYFLVNKNDFYENNKINNDFLKLGYVEQIKKICQCNEITFYRLNISVFEHIFLFKKSKNEGLLRL
jgi:hypothetical protein